MLDLVDEGRIALTPCCGAFHLLPEEQRNLIETIESEDCTPSLSQSVRMRKLSNDGLLTMDKIFEIMTGGQGQSGGGFEDTDRQSPAIFAEHHLQADGRLYRKGIGTLCALPEDKRNRDSR